MNPLRICLASTIAVSAASGALAGPDLPPGMTILNAPPDPLVEIPFSMSADGRTVVGAEKVVVEREPELFRRGVLWSVGGGRVPLDLLGASSASNENGVLTNATGDFVIGTSTISPSVNGFLVRWDADGTGVLIDESPTAPQGFGNSILSMTPDGSVVVGSARTGPFSFRVSRWTEGVGSVLLADVPGSDDFGHARGISEDGLTIVGEGMPDGGSPFGQLLPCAWFDGGTEVTLLGALDPENPWGGTAAVSADGSIISGWSGLDELFLPKAGFIWTATDGMQPTPGLVSFGRSASMAPDGSWVLGTGDDEGQGVWRPGQGVVPVAVWLEELGFELPEPYRSTVVVIDVSDDRRAILAESDDVFFHYLLPEIACETDINGSGAVDEADLIVVIDAWGTPDGDVDGDGTTDVDDLLLVLITWGPCS